MGAAYLDTIAHDLLDAALDGLALARTGIAAPTRTYVSHSRPAVDICEGDENGQLSVYLDPGKALTLQSAPDRPAVPRQVLRQPIANFIIEWWRCHVAFTVDGQIPTADELDDAASMLLTDLWCVETQLFDEQRDGTLVDVGCLSVEIGTATALGPQGGAAGWTIPVRVALSDTGPAGAPIMLALQPAGAGAQATI